MRCPIVVHSLTPLTALLAAGLLMSGSRERQASAPAPACDAAAIAPSAAAAAALAAAKGDVLIITHDDGSIEIIDNPKMVPHLDIKPGSCPNPVNIDPNGGAGQGSMTTAVIAVSILGNAFDVSQVDLGSLHLRLADPLLGKGIEPFQITFSDTGTPFGGELCACHDLTGDGLLDLDMKFDGQQVIDEFGLANIGNGEFVMLEVVGTAREGRDAFSARDCIRVINHDDGE